MSILHVARLGHPVLRQVARSLTDDEIRSDEIQRLIDDMGDTLIEYDGVGLAAPQVHRDIQLLIVDVPPGAGESLSAALINPVIEAASEEMEDDWEGCLSIPDMRGRVPRHLGIRVRAKDRDAKEIVLDATEFTARVIQHEIDHLRGIVYFDRMTDFSTLTFNKEHARYWTKRDSDGS